MTTKSKPPKSVAMTLGQVAGNLEFLQACERNMPKGKRIVAVRADSAAYQAVIFNWCEVTGKLFAIGADPEAAVKAAIAGIPERLENVPRRRDRRDDPWHEQDRQGLQIDRVAPTSGLRDSPVTCSSASLS
jgi:hypothetical protein